jgi:uncharacterized protein YjbJ (UPF0337 family)
MRSPVLNTNALPSQKNVNRERRERLFVELADTSHTTKELGMDWNRVEGNWKQVKGKIKEKWGKLTDDDLNVIEGRRDQLEGKIQQRYGFAKDQTKKDVDDWVNAQKW